MQQSTHLPPMHGGQRVRAFPPDLPEDVVPEGTKGRILRAALVAFAERGFHGTSIRTIADVAGINSATLYSHFAAKEQILEALVTIGVRELLARLEEALVGTSTGLERLDAIMRATVLGHARYPLLSVVSNSEFHVLSDEIAAPALVPVAEGARLLRAALAQGTAEGSFNISDPTITARTLEGMAQRIPHWINPGTDDPNHLADEYVLLARRLVGAPAP
ncbi:MAG: Transcriptional regulator, TetR family [Glaciihabitans sp.]|nr:Transcriptional regulator, TetR family [Glaciihabitans sp.]